MPQGRDLVRGVGEDGLGGVAIAFAIGLLFFAIQAWSWSRIVIASNYGTNRELWRPRWLLEWGPRVLAFLPFAAAGLALLISFKWNASVGLLLLAIGVVFLGLLIFREPMTKRLAGDTETAPWVQGAWVIAGLAMAFSAMVIAILWPAAIGVKLGAPAIVFFGLGFIIPVITIACELGTSLRIPVVGALLLWAVLIGAFFDNHQVGRRALVAETGGSTDRPTLESAFKRWADHQPVDPNGKKTMVLVAVQGGASRAGYWTAVALSSLREAAKAKAVDIDSHIFALSSVSGGSVGAVGYAAMLKTARDDKNFRNDLLGFAGRDALGPALTGMLYSDLLYRFLPLWLLPDRAETLERAWEEAWDAPDNRTGLSPKSSGPSARRSSRLRQRTANPGGRFSSCRARAKAVGGACSRARSGSPATRSTPTTSSTALATTSPPRPRSSTARAFPGSVRAARSRIGRATPKRAIPSPRTTFSTAVISTTPGPKPYAK